ncbi:hypothetical protein LUQ84_002992 [Hamiltosporidium tvaerminnensis]|nr:hypothetical protein LUQ84_002992 [Hamiltosporidium tvaerminnensis]
MSFIFLCLSLFISNSFSSIKAISSTTNADYVRNLVDKTVVLIETEVMYWRNDKIGWEKIQDDIDISTHVLISHSSDYNRKSFETGNFVGERSKEGNKGSFLFTAPSHGYYMFSLNVKGLEEIYGDYNNNKVDNTNNVGNVDNNNVGNVGNVDNNNNNNNNNNNLQNNNNNNNKFAIRTRIYEGRQSDPRIVSQADTQIKEVEKQIALSVDYSKQISEEHKLSEEVDKLFSKNVSKIVWLVVLSVGFKILLMVMGVFFHVRLVKNIKTK